MEPRACIEAEPFALQVTDASMEPEFRQGCVIIIDPTGRAADGAYVLAEIRGEHIFRQLRLAEGRVWLQALDSSCPKIEPDRGMAAIKGVVVQRAGTRRSYHKHCSPG